MWICAAVYRSISSPSDRHLPSVGGFAGKISDIIESDKFQEPERVRAEEKREMERLAAEEEATTDKKKKKKEKKKKKQPDEDSGEEEEVDGVSLTEPFIKRLRGTEALKAMVRKHDLFRCSF